MDQNSTLYLNVVHVLNTSANYTSVAAKDSCFSALVSNRQAPSLTYKYKTRIVMTDSCRR